MYITVRQFFPEKLGDIATFNDWDFANTWVIKTAQYPTFRNQSADADISNLNIPDGSQARPFEITSAAGLKSIGNDEESLTKHYVLKNNISMKYNSDYIQMDPIGSEDTPFTGSLDGNGFTISDLKITSQKSVNGQDYSALFAVNNGTVKNLRFAVATIGENGVENASVVAGINNGTIEQVAIETGGKITAKNAAGFAIENNGTIENSYITSTALVSNNASAGIVISNNAGATIGYVFANANLSSSMFDKASIAINSDGTITHTHGVMGALFVKNDTSIVTTNDNSSIAASDLYVQSIFSDWNFNDIWYMTSGSYPMLQVTNKASSVSAQSIDLFADGETTCEHIVYIRDTKNSANIYIKAQNPYSTIAIRGGSYTGVFEGVINGLINDKTIIPFTITSTSGASQEHNLVIIKEPTLATLDSVVIDGTTVARVNNTYVAEIGKSADSVNAEITPISGTVEVLDKDRMLFHMRA
mgnify:CR=1 FL=1